MSRRFSFGYPNDYEHKSIEQAGRGAVTISPTHRSNEKDLAFPRTVDPTHGTDGRMLEKFDRVRVAVLGADIPGRTSAARSFPWKSVNSGTLFKN